MPPLDESFTSAPLDELAAIALQRATELGAGHADVRIARTKWGQMTVRDGRLEANSDTESLGLGVRVIVDGTWGFATSNQLGPEGARGCAERAVAAARQTRAVVGRRVEIAPEPVHAKQVWVSEYERNPFEVPEAERVARLAELTEALLAGPGVHHAEAELWISQENKFYADVHGTSTLQQRIGVSPTVTAFHVDRDTAGFSSMKSLAPAVGRGWEYLTGTGWDFDTEVAELPELLAEHVAAPGVTAGTHDLVIDPTNLWLTIHETIGHGTELDRAMGHEADLAGTTFATPDQIGTLQYGSPLVNVTGDRDAPHGLATIGFDDEGVRPRRFDIIKDGVLDGFQLNRQMAHEHGLGRSNGCTFAQSAEHLPLQRMPNVSLRPDPDGGSTEDLIAQVEDGIYIVGDRSWSVDMQRRNFQFTGQRCFRIRDGRLAGQLRDVVYQGSTPEFWGSMTAAGGPGTYLLGGSFRCGKGQPIQIASVSHGSPSALFRGVNVLNANAEGAR
ncbi:TldD/PmbA family protein [Streptomyces sp. NPDC051985]|uniref:TldD/PmbA family protein n=1 Tax=Streptomyces sp. NPDC051985 TaxID=3155807 RepID=UPI003441B07B